MTSSGRINDARYCIRAQLDGLFPDYPAMSMADADAIATTIALALDREGRLADR